ncbi:hypothetical protein GCM10010252_04480 [Streptomyces aureoverticillatus]|nr:hypothetical protein GCM10010252_04480 [Streptomyces aureoverticillatus]
MIEPGGIPQFTGNFEQLDKDISALRSDAIGIRNGGSDVHSRFQMLGAYYVAPEAHDLFASTQPVMDGADSFATALESVADALETFAAEARPLAKRLETLQEKASAFVKRVEGDDDWTYDGEKTDRSNELRDQVSEAESAFRAAERRAATKISALVNGPKFVEDDGSGRKPTKKVIPYGYDAELLKKAKELPWGTPVSESIHVWEVHRHLKHYVWDGFVVDGVGGAIQGLGHLVGVGGSAKEAWGNLGDVLGGIGQYTVKPYDWVLDHTIGPDEESAGEKRQKDAAREFAKGVVAWDQWKVNPARAAGTATFNVVTLGAGVLGTLSKGGSVGAKAAGAGAKIGTYADPVSAGLTVGGKAVSKMPKVPQLPKVSDLTARIRGGAGAGAAVDTPPVHSVIELDDGSKVRVGDGEFTPSRNGVDETGTVPHEPSAAARAVSAEHAREYGLAGVGSRTPEGGVGRGESLAPHASASHDPSAGHSAAQSPHGQGHDQTGGAAGARGADSAGQNGTVDSAPGGGRSSGGAGGDGAGTGPDTSTGSGSDTPGRPGRAERPSFMREGDNPYGPRGSLTREQIEEIQVYRANHEPGYFNEYYKGGEHLGDRKRLDLTDESGFTPPQLTRLSDNGPLIRAKDVPEPPKPHFIDADYMSVRADTVTSAARLKILNEAAQNRHFAIQWDHLIEKLKAETGRAHEAQGTLESGGLWGEAKGAYKESHTVMGNAAEEFGESAARHHYIAERYPDFVEQTLLGPKNGNDQFDQMWKHEDGRIVVVEAKSSPGTGLGRRTLPGGRQVSQGSREYFFDIIEAMKKRGEFGRVKDLQKALKEGKLEYVVVKGENNTGAYTGYQYRRFDISKGTLP